MRTAITVAGARDDGSELLFHIVRSERDFVLLVTSRVNEPRSNYGVSDNLRPISCPLCHDRSRRTPIDLDPGLGVGASFCAPGRIRY